MIILTPKFKWSKPADWSKVLLNQELQLIITCYNNRGDSRQQPYLIDTFNNPYYYKPEFTLSHPIHIPENLWEGIPNDNEFPVKAVLELKGVSAVFEFDVMLVYDAALE